LSKPLYITILLFISLLPLKSQNNDPDRFIQVSGIITDEYNKPVQGVGVISRKMLRATISERTGIYSITSKPGDTILFRALGYKRYHTVIPTDFEGRRAMVDIILEADTISIETVTILPWRSYNEFIKEMTKEKPEDPIVKNMNENLASIYVAVSNQTGVRVSPEAGYRYVMEQNFSNMATRNQYPYNNLLNPFAWSKFFTEVKKGLLRNQTISKPKQAKPVKKKKRAGK